jgi:zinc protease
MKKLFFFILAAGLACMSPFALSAQENSPAKTNLSKKIPVSPNVKKGKLKNGLTYYIRRNKKPENHLELRLVVDAGSILEDSDQLGMAHLMEHMNFNGTKHFKKNELVDYLQNIGVKFGADLNASTGFDRTTYILPIPTDSTKEVNEGFQILEDWAHEALLKHDMIKGERGVVLEEYRLGLGADKRMREQYFPIILRGSRYAKRLPIGTKESILHSKDSSLRRFYHQWYRPGLEAVIAVGDLPVQTIYKKIKKYFGGIPTLKNPRDRKTYSIPNHKKTYVAVASDSEATNTVVRILNLDEGKRKPVQTVGDFRRELVQRLFTTMINNRLDEKRNKPNPPFMLARSSHGQFVSPEKETYRSIAVTNQDSLLKGMKTLLLVNKRVRKYGFLQDELKRAKKDLLSSLESQYKGRKTETSSSYVGNYISNYMKDSPIPGISWKYKEAKKFVPGIKLSEVSSLIDQFLHQDNRDVLVTGPPLKGSKKALKQNIRKLLVEVAHQKVTPYKEKKVRSRLMRKKPKMGSITDQSADDSLGTTTLTLSNGAKVVYKKTDFKDNQILFQAFSYGGTSLYSNDVYRQTDLANDGLTQAGVAGLSKSDLKKVLSGKNVSVSPFISELIEGLQGNSTPQDMETMFQLIHLYFTSLNKDQDAFDSYISKQKTRYSKLLSNPQFYFIAQFNNFINGQNNPRYVGFPTPQKLDKANYNLAYKKYQQRFANAGDFTFYFVGDIPVKAFEKDVKTYLAGLPSGSKREKYKVLPYRPLSGTHKKVVYKGKAPKSLVELVYDGETGYSPAKDFRLQVLGDILTIELTNTLREKDSGVYTVNAKGGASKIPYGSFHFVVAFPCGPDNVPKLIKAAEQEVGKIIKNGPTDEDLKKVKKHQLLQYKKDMKKNQYWLSHLLQPDINQTSKTAFLHFKKKVNSLTKDDIQQIANEYLTKGHITGILYPEKKKDNKVSSK